jgi:hypothetical protein
VENALKTISMVPPQITLEARVAQVKADSVDAFFKDATLTRRLVVTNEFLAALPKGSARSEVVLRAAQELAVDLKVPVASTIKTVEAREYVISSGQLRSLLRSLENREGINLMTMASVTTLPGRAAKVSVEETRSVITEDTEVKNNQIHSGAVLFPSGPSVLFYPKVVSEKETQYDVTFQNMEFLGYADDKKIPLPKFLVRSGSASISMPDSYTQVIVHPSAKDPKLWLIQFFTPVALDPAGNRISDTAINPPSR